MEQFSEIPYDSVRCRLSLARARARFIRHNFYEGVSELGASAGWRRDTLSGEHAAVISGRLPIIKRNESAEHSRMHVRSLACMHVRRARGCVRVSVVSQQWDGGDGAFFLPPRWVLSPAKGAPFPAPRRPPLLVRKTSWTSRDADSPFVFRRKEKGRKSSRPRRASDKTKHPGGCLRTAPVIRDVERRIWWIGRASTRCPRTEKARAPRRPIGRAGRTGAPAPWEFLGRLRTGFAPVAPRCGRRQSILRRTDDFEDTRGRTRKKNWLISFIDRPQSRL